MSASDPNSAVFMSDTPAQIKVMLPFHHYPAISNAPIEKDKQTRF
jgi:tryptophanyl-tRNA synthetase